jgi:hypothetical protein
VTPKHQLALRFLAPALLLAVAGGVWWLLGPLIDADPTETHLRRTYVIGGASEFLVIFLVSLVIARLEKAGQRHLLSHLRHSALLYLVGGFALYPLATNNAGHLSHVLGFMLTLAIGAITGDALGLVLGSARRAQAEA